jgi:hypothetical protein
MATSKSTVLGIRLDHDRRAWVEAEAARRGVTVRVLFEGLIDEAQAGRSAGAEVGATESATGPAVGDRSAGEFASAAGPGDFAAELRASWPPPPRGAAPLPDVGSLAALPGRLIRGAISLPVNIIKTSGRCASKSLESCPALRSWSGRSG